MKILVVDGQGGGVGKALISQLRSVVPQATVIAVGTNSIAASMICIARNTVVHLRSRVLFHLQTACSNIVILLTFSTRLPGSPRARNPYAAGRFRRNSSGSNSLAYH